jgi:alkylhydroperoxidase family enzyme
MEFSGFSEMAAGGTTALTALSKAVDDSGLEKTPTESIRTRTWQTNDDASCLQFPFNLACKEKVSQTKLDFVALWREAGVFSLRKSSALAWTETLTHGLSVDVTDACYRDATKVLRESELAILTETVAWINAWKRVAIPTRFTSSIPQDCAQV